jgi:hypothetical protein
LQISYNINKEAKEEQIAKVKQRIRFILSHFEGRQPLFPRKMSTALSQGRQFIVYNEEQILNECIKANFIDCRLNAYPDIIILEHSQSDEFDIFSTIQAPNIFLLILIYQKSLKVRKRLQ